MFTERSKSIYLTILMLVSMVIWGGSWVSGKIVAGALPSETLTFWRFVITFVFMIPPVLLLKEPIRLTRSAAFYMTLGSIFMGAYLYLFFKGLELGGAGASGVLVTTTMPIFTFALSAIFLRRKAALKEVIGLALGVVGGALLLKLWTFDSARILSGGSAYFILGAMCWAALTICSQKSGASVSPIVFSLVTSAFCAVLFFVPAMNRGITAVFDQGLSFWLNMFYMAVISSAFATTVYFAASSRLNASRASSFAFVVPSSAVLFGLLFLGEAPEASTIIGGIMAIGATYIINA